MFLGLPHWGSQRTRFRRDKVQRDRSNTHTMQVANERLPPARPLPDERVTSRDSDRLLLVPQRHQGVESRSPVCRYVSGEQRYQTQQQRQPGQCQRVNIQHSKQ